MKFVQESYDANDALAKELLMNFLMRRGHTIVSHVEDYGVDISTEKDSELYWFEAEIKIKRPWTNKEDFPFDTVSFLGRKKKWGDYYYFIICRETGAALFCHCTEIYKDEYKEIVHVNSPGRSGADVFFRVPKEKCIFVEPNTFLHGLAGKDQIGV